MDYQKFDEVISKETLAIIELIKSKEAECDKVIAKIEAGIQLNPREVDRYYDLKQDILNLKEEI